MTATRPHLVTPYAHTTIHLQGVTGEYIPVIPSGQDLQDELDGYLCGDIPLFHMVNDVFFTMSCVHIFKHTLPVDPYLLFKYISGMFRGNTAEY